MSKWTIGITCLIVVLLATRSLQQRTFKGFVENDAIAEEGTNLSVTIDVSGATAPVAVSLIQLTFEQYDQLLDSAKMVCENLGFSDSGIDHAEESDFDTTVTTKEISVSADFVIRVLDDAMQEPSEVFVIYLNSSDPGVSFDKQCIRVKIREDNSDMALLNVNVTGSTAVNEDVGQINRVRFIREGQTEFPIFITLETLSRDRDATKNEDYTLDVTNDTLELRPEDTSIDLPITVIDDTVAEYTENIAFVVQWRFGSGGQIFVYEIKIPIVDNENVRLGFINDTTVLVLEGETVTLCVGDFTNFTSQRDNDGIRINTQPETAITNKHFREIMQGPGYTTPTCVTLEMIDDDILEDRRDFRVTVAIAPFFFPNQPVSDLYDFQPDTVTVRIRDNDGVPNKPIITDFKPTANKDEVFAAWTTTPHPLRPIDGYTIQFRVLGGDPEKEDVVRVMNLTVERDVEERIFKITDLEKVYDIKICAVNEFGETCSDVSLVQVTPAPLVPDESGLPTGALIGIIIGAIILAVCCCLWFILFLICVWCCGEREKKYFPANKEKKYAKEHEEYRSKRESSALSGESISDDDFSDYKNNP